MLLYWSWQRNTSSCQAVGGIDDCRMKIKGNITAQKLFGVTMYQYRIYPVRHTVYMYEEEFTQAQYLAQKGRSELDAESDWTRVTIHPILNHHLNDSNLIIQVILLQNAVAHQVTVVIHPKSIPMQYVRIWAIEVIHLLRSLLLHMVAV